MALLSTSLSREADLSLALRTVVVVIPFAPAGRCLLRLVFLGYTPGRLDVLQHGPRRCYGFYHRDRHNAVLQAAPFWFLLVLSSPFIKSSYLCRLHTVIHRSALIARALLKTVRINPLTLSDVSGIERSEAGAKRTIVLPAAMQTQRDRTYCYGVRQTGRSVASSMPA